MMMFRRPAVAVAFTLLVAICGAPHAARAAAYVNETFTGAQVANPAWEYAGGACLTAGTGTAFAGSIPGCPSGPQPGGVNGTFPEASGSGALRLTSNAQSQSGFVLYTLPQSSAAGLQATFTEYSYDGTNGSNGVGADGLSFFFADATPGDPPIAPGGNGGSLGYAQNATTAGLVHGYLGIGFDEFGNFSSATEGRVGGPGNAPEEVAIRGNAGSAYKYVTGYKGGGLLGTGLLGANSLPFDIDTYAATTRGAVAKRTWRVTLTTALKLTVEIDRGGGFQTALSNVDVSTVNGTTFPSSFYFGFASSTGTVTNVHEIANLSVASIAATAAVANGPVNAVLATGSYDGVSAVNGNDDFTEKSFSQPGFTAVYGAVSPAAGSRYTSALAGIAVPNQIANLGPLSDTIALAATAPTAPTGWTVQLFPDNGLGVPGSGQGLNGPALTAYPGSIPGATSSASVTLATGAAAIYWAVYASPANAPVFTRFDASIVAKSTNSATVTDTTHDELYSGFAYATKTVAVTSSGCPPHATPAPPVGTVCPSGTMHYAITYANVALAGGAGNTEPATALLATKPGTFTLTEDGGAGTNNWATMTTGLRAPPVDSNGSSTFTYGAASPTFATGAVTFTDTVGGAAGTLGPGASGTIVFDLVAR